MQIIQVQFPQPDLCQVQVREDAAAYEAVIEQMYEKFGQFYPVKGHEGLASRQLIEQRYGAQVFRLEAINHLLTHEFNGLQAQLCAQQGLVPLTEAEPQLLSDDETGFVVECTFATVPQVQVTGYTGNTLPGPAQAGVKVLLQQVAQQCGVSVSSYAMQVESANRQDALAQKLRETQTELKAFLEQAGKTEEELLQDIAASVWQDFAQRTVLQNIARQENLLTTEQQLEEEIDRMVAISEQNAYARTNPAARRSIAQRLTNQRTLEWLCAHNQFAE